jgi:type II secretory pathway predicted ATPase ExeA
MSSISGSVPPGGPIRAPLTASPPQGDHVGKPAFRPIAPPVARPISVREPLISKESEPEARVTPRGEPAFADTRPRLAEFRRVSSCDEVEQPSFYTNAKIQHVYGSLISAITAGPGLFLLTGEAGVGKTHMVQRLRDELQAAGYLVMSRYSAGLTFAELMVALDDDLRLGIGDPADPAKWLERFHRMLSYRQGLPAVLTIDRAEQLRFDILDNLKQLLVPAEPLAASLRILLSGRPEIASRLNLPVFDDLKARVVSHCQLERLTDEDAKSYAFHRLRQVGESGAAHVTPGAVANIVHHAAGVPRRINLLCSRALRLAAVADAAVTAGEIGERTAEQTAGQATVSPESRGPRRVRSGVMGGVVAGMLVAGTLAYSFIPGDRTSVDHAAGDAIPVAEGDLTSIPVPENVSLSAPADGSVARTAELAPPVDATEPSAVNATGVEPDLGAEIPVAGGQVAGKPDDAADAAPVPAGDAPAAEAGPLAAEELASDQSSSPAPSPAPSAAAASSAAMPASPEEDARPPAAEAAAPVLVAPPVATEPLSAPAVKSAGPVEQPAPPADRLPATVIAALQRRGDQLLSVGDIAAARLCYERAAAGGSALAAASVGKTYDPAFLRAAGVRGMRGDPTLAAEWYRKAARMGDAEAAAE